MNDPSLFLPAVRDQHDVVHAALHQGFFTYALCKPDLASYARSQHDDGLRLIQTRDAVTCPACIELQRKAEHRKRAHLSSVP